MPDKPLWQRALEWANPRSERAGVFNVPVDPPSMEAERFFKETDGFDLGPFGPRLERLKAPSLLTDEGTLRQHQRADWQNVDWRMQLFAARLIEVFRKQGVPFYVHCAYRSPAEQLEAYRRGVSKVRGPRAAHTCGAAVDIVHSRYHWELTPGEWAIIGKFGRDLAQKMGLKVVWGGNDGPGDKFAWDPAHWELADWREIADVPVAREPLRRTPRAILAYYRGH